MPHSAVTKNRGMAKEVKRSEGGSLLGLSGLSGLKCSWNTSEFCKSTKAAPHRSD